jgi:hypothetical protein
MREAPSNNGMKPTKSAMESCRGLRGITRCSADEGGPHPEPRDGDVLPFASGIVRSGKWWSMPKDKDEARAEGFKRGLAGKRDAAGLTQGWTDGQAASVARSEGWVAGKRKRSQLEVAAAAKARRKK